MVIDPCQLACAETQGDNRNLTTKHSAAVSGSVNLVKETISLSWEIASLNSNRLIVKYSVINRNKFPVLILDRLLTPYGHGEYLLLEDEMVVQNGQPVGVVELIRGHVDSGARLAQPWGPATRRVGPGETVTGNAQLTFPLKSWHYTLFHDAPVPDNPTAFVLKIGYIDRQDIVWMKRTLTNGTILELPTLGYVVILSENDKFA
jgi:hypothetical protein